MKKLLSLLALSVFVFGGLYFNTMTVEAANLCMLGAKPNGGFDIRAGSRVWTKTINNQIEVPRGKPIVLAVNVPAGYTTVGTTNVPNISTGDDVGMSSNIMNIEVSTSPCFGSAHDGIIDSAMVQLYTNDDPRRLTAGPRATLVPGQVNYIMVWSTPGSQSNPGTVWSTYIQYKNWDTANGGNASITTTFSNGQYFETGMSQAFSAVIENLNSTTPSDPSRSMGPATVSAITISQSLSLYSRDENTNGQVSILQTLLKNTVCPDLFVSGFFGVRTDECLRLYQTNNGIPALGVTGPLTRTALADPTRKTPAVVGGTYNSTNSNYTNLCSVGQKPNGGFDIRNNTVAWNKDLGNLITVQRGKPIVLAVVVPAGYTTVGVTNVPNIQTGDDASVSSNVMNIEVSTSPCSGSARDGIIDSAMRQLYTKDDPRAQGSALVPGQVNYIMVWSIPSNGDKNTNWSTSIQYKNWNGTVATTPGVYFQPGVPQTFPTRLSTVNGTSLTTASVARIVTGPSDEINLGTAAAQDRLTSGSSFLRSENLSWSTLCSNASIKPVLNQNNPKSDYDRQLRAGLEVYPFDMTGDANFIGAFTAVGISSSANTPVYGFISDTPCAGTATNVYRFNGGIGGTVGQVLSTNSTKALSGGETGIIKITPGRWYVTLLWGTGDKPAPTSQNYASWVNGTARLNVRFANTLVGTTGVSNNTGTNNVSENINQSSVPSDPNRSLGQATVVRENLNSTIWPVDPTRSIGQTTVVTENLNPTNPSDPNRSIGQSTVVTENISVQSVCPAGTVYVPVLMIGHFCVPLPSSDPSRSMGPAVIIRENLTSSTPSDPTRSIGQAVVVTENLNPTNPSDPNRSMGQSTVTACRQTLQDYVQNNGTCVGDDFVTRGTKKPNSTCTGPDSVVLMVNSGVCKDRFR